MSDGSMPGSSYGPGFNVFVSAIVLLIAIAFALLKKERARLFVSGQQTPMLNSELLKFLGDQKLERPIKAAMPPFNRRLKIEPLPSTIPFDVPVFGPRISNAVMNLFKSDEMRDLATSLLVRVPSYKLSDFIQKKMIKVRVLIEHARSRSDCAFGVNAAAVERLSNFVSDFTNLEPSDVPDRAAWVAFCTKYCPPDWEAHLHFKHVLSSCFGFESDVALAILEHTHAVPNSKTGVTEYQTLEQFSARWLTKALGAFGPDGCVGDVVNLAVCMMCEKPPADSSETVIVAILESFKNILDQLSPKSIDRLWIPTHVQHDSELDDTLSWLLLEYVRRRCCLKPIRTLVQLPVDSSFDALQKHFIARGCRTFRDPNSENGAAIQRNLDYLIDS